MPPRVVEALDVLEDPDPHAFAARPRVAVEQFPFERRNEGFGQGVVVGVGTGPIEGTRPASLSLPPKLTDVYWRPLSEWCTRPAAGRQLWIAMFRASGTSSVLRWLAIDQPTTLREQASSTNAS
jgi:hypothetical protein